MNRPHDATSSALLAAAHHLLSNDGADALTVRRIASEAGMSTMNVYSRFGGKDGVVDELYADGFRRLITQIDGVPIGDDLADNIIHVADAYRDFALANSTYYAIMFRAAIAGFEPSDDSIAVALGLLEMIVERVRIGQAAGRIPDDVTPSEVAAWLWATCHGLVSLELDGLAAEVISWESIWRSSMRMAVASLQASFDDMSH